MTLSIWRYAHLALALVSFIFLLILSITGVILAYDAVEEKFPDYKIEHFESLHLDEVIPVIKQSYSEVVSLSVDHNQFVILEGTNQEGDDVNAYIDPRDGKVIGEITPKSEFIQWNLALHRSLFLKETGRIIIGIVSFLLCLITLSGIVLIIKRQQGIRHFFAKINRDFFAQYFHVAGGRLLLIPILVLSLTGTYLFLIRIEVISKPTEVTTKYESKDEELVRTPNEFPIFQQTKLSEVTKIEFPFIEDDEEEFYVLKLKDRVVTVNQITGDLVEETWYSTSSILENISLDLHTGRTNILWAIILGISSLNIVAFIYSGFVITLRRTRTKIKNTYQAHEAEIVILVGTENGSTLFFANQIHSQLLANGQRSFLAQMNQWQDFPNAHHLLLFTSTYGLGTAPSNATGFIENVRQLPQHQKINFAVVGFGSMAYPDYCQFALDVDQVLAEQTWATRYLEVHTVNDKSAEEFVKWVQAWSEKSQLTLATAPALYTAKVAALTTFKVIEKTAVNDYNDTFTLRLKPNSATRFQSGDLLTIYPADDQRERYYSIAKDSEGILQLVVKLFPNGLGSSYLYNLSPSQELKARIVVNKNFHFPTNAKAVVMIGNGTGIAPFLGMIMNNHEQTPVHLYAGFRKSNDLTWQYEQFALKEMAAKHLAHFEIAYSREQKKQYVMDLIKRDAQYIASVLANKGVIMICGSLRMYKDVEELLDTICRNLNQQEIGYYYAQNQILSDCY